MGRRSVKEDKNIFQVLREAKGYSREKASELLETITYSRLIRIESGETFPYPEEIITMAEVYREPNLPNIYCASECPLGQAYIAKVEVKELPIITLEMLNEITVDGEITPDEYRDFQRIKNDLEQMSMTIDSMQLWIDNKIVEGKIEKDALK